MAFQMNISKFRQATPKENSKTQWYSDLKVNTSSDCCPNVATDGYAIAVHWATAAGAAISFLPFGVFSKRPDPPLLRVHSGALNDLAFSPIQPNLLVTSSEDCTVKYWKPNPNDPSRSTNLCTLNGHKKGVWCFALHPTASDIIATGSSDKTMKIWDANTSAEKLSLDFGDTVASLVWNFNGSLLSATSKDKKLHIIDPRNSNFCASIQAHDGIKPAKSIWAGKKENIISCGFDRTQSRQIAVWDPRNLTTPLLRKIIGSASGTPFLFYDPDTDILTVSSKGEGGLKFYDCLDISKPTDTPSLTSDNITKGICSVPKPRLNILGCEIAHYLKTTANAIVPVTLFVPRKKHDFQSDLFPDTAAPKPALTSSEWLSGKDANPTTMPLFAENPNLSYSSAPIDTSVPTPNPMYVPIVEDAVDYGSKTTTKIVAEVKKEIAPKPIQRTEPKKTFAVGSIVRYSKFRNVVDKPFARNTKIEELKVNTNTSTSLIKINPLYSAVPWQGAGGRVAVLPFSQNGRIGKDCPTLLIGSNLMDMDFDPFDHHRLVTGGEDGHIKAWNIPSEMGVTKDISTPLLDLVGHKRKLSTINFHPTANNVLASSSVDNTIMFWDLATSQSKITIPIPDALYNLSFDYNGSRIATACKDSRLRLFDIRSNNLLGETIAHEGAKGFSSSWGGNDELVVTAGFSKMSERTIRLWDLRDLSKPVNEIFIDSQSGVLSMYYDYENDFIAVYGKGDGNMRYYEIAEDETTKKKVLFYLTETQAGQAVADMSFMPKTSLNVLDCEIAQAARLVGSPPSVIERTQLIIPRVRTEFFQDDIFPPTRSEEPSFSSADWFSGKTGTIKMKNLQPRGTKKLSEAPAIEKKQKYHVPTDEELNAEKGITRDDVFNKFFDRMKVVTDEQEEVDEVAKRKAEEADGWAVNEDEWD